MWNVWTVRGKISVRNEYIVVLGVLSAATMMVGCPASEAGGSNDAAPSMGDATSLPDANSTSKSTTGDATLDGMAPSMGTMLDSTSDFGKSCTTASDCGGNAPICGAPQLPVCLNIMCSTGEVNAGICPATWTCFPAGGGNPSACVPPM